MRARRASIIAIVLSGIGVGAWWSLRPDPPRPPAVPTDGLPTEVAAALLNARAEVLAKPTDAEAWGQLGLLYAAHGFDDESAACWREAARLDPTDDRWPYLLGIYFLTDGRDPGQAMRRFEVAALREHRSVRHEVAAQLRLGEACLAERQWADAEDIFRKQLTRDPQDARAAVGLGLALLNQERPADARPFLEKGLTTPHVRRKAATNLAAASRLLNDSAAAERYDRQVATLPEDVPPPDPFIAVIAAMKPKPRDPYEEVVALEAAGRLADTVPVLERLAADPENVKAAFLLGRSLALLGRPSEAESHLRRACSLDSGHAQAALLLGATLFDLAMKEAEREKKTRLLRESVESSARAETLAPGLAVAHFTRGMALRELGDRSEAVQHLRLAADAKPESEDFQLAYLEALIDAGRHSEASAHLPIAERVVTANRARLTALSERLRSAPKQPKP